MTPTRTHSSVSQMILEKPIEFMNVIILFHCLGALKAVSERTDESNDGETINELALAGIKNIVEKQEVTVDLHSAVYIFHLIQVLIKHVSAADAHNAHVGKYDFLLFKMDYSNDSCKSQSIHCDFLLLGISATLQNLFIT